MASRIRTAAAQVEGSTWLFVLLVLLTLLPAACVLWFLGEALTIESSAAEQRILEAYRGQLRLVRARLEPLWQTHAARISLHGGPEQHFARLVDSGIAEGAIVLDPGGGIAYPDRGVSPDVRSEGVARRPFALEAHASPLEGSEADAVAAVLNDYAAPMPAAARLDLMDRLRRVAPNVFMPTQAALRLSLDMLDAERPVPAEEVIRHTALPDIWALTSSDRRVIALYRTGRLEAMMHDFLHQVTPEGIRFIAFPPGVPADEEAVAAGPWLPGWQLSFAVLEQPPIAPPHGMRYISVALAGVALIGSIGIVAAGTLRRHLRVARLKTDLIAAASHELRTPLASMRVLVDGLLADNELDPVKTREYLTMVSSENARLSRVIESFLTFSRLERGRWEFVFDAVPPAAVADAAIAGIRDRVPSGCTLRVDVAPGLKPVRADADALVTALVNLLDNALKYSSVEPAVDFRVRSDGGSVAFEVADNGIGIHASEQNRIFRRFYRVDQRLARDTSGAGLGLSIVQLIVRAHGGRVDVRSGPGAGSTFTVRVPVAEGARA